MYDHIRIVQDYPERILPALCPDRLAAQELTDPEFNIVGYGEHVRGTVCAADYEMVGYCCSDIPEVQGNHILTFLFQHCVGNDLDDILFQSYF